MRFKGALLIALFLAFSVSFVSACPTVNSQDINAYMNEIPSINSQLANCNIQVQGNIHSIVGDGNVLVTVGGTNQFYVTITNQVVTGVTAGTPQTYSYEVSMSDATFASLLTSNDVYNAILAGLNNGDITVTGSNLWYQIMWFFASWFLPGPNNPPAGNPTGQGAGLPQGVTGKPDYCDETYLPGHQGYAQNQDVWDEYSRNTDNVCQSQFGRGAPSPCIYTVQLSVSGNPYYLCWYNE